ncbi:MAG: acyl-CoA thioesterase [Candidatus Marinimicrobia bacterium]|jgi:acyl-CoA thioester hydrolase|nr:acyl-CoA thioesterase [Candidatus Neomarinimicrobiota bacterium]
MVSAEVIIIIPFHDVDVTRVVWHGHYVKYMEIARCTLLDKINYNYIQMERSGYSWPVIDLRIRYARPLYFQQKIRVKVRLSEWENRLKIKYLFEDFDTGQRLTRAYSVQVAVDIVKNEMLLASPEIIYQKLGIKL